MSVTLRKIVPYQAKGVAAGSETISSQAHDVASPYSIDFGDTFTVSANYTGTGDLIVEVNDKFFGLPISGGSGSVTISSRQVGTGTNLTIQVHGPLAASKNCANPITIVTTELQKEIRQIVKDFIEEHFSVTGWTTRINEAWYEKSRDGEFQIFLLTDNKRGIAKTDHIQRDMDRITSPIIYDTIVYVYVSAPTEDGRFTLAKEMRSIFEDTSISRDYVSGVDAMFIDNEYPIDKDCKQECPSWMMIFEIRVLW
jgi:hypothetical protein